MNGGLAILARLGLSLLGLTCACVSAAEEAGSPPHLLDASTLPVEIGHDRLERQYDALASMPSVVVEYSVRGPVSKIEGDTALVIDKATRRLEPGEIAPGLLQTFSDVLLATGDEKLVVLDNHNSSDLRISILKTAQTIRDLPVIFGYVGLTIDESTGLVRSFSANFLPDRGLPKHPKISAARAAALVTKALEGSGDARPGTVTVTTEPTLAYYANPTHRTAGNLVWAVNVSYVSSEGGSSPENVWLDAVSGMVVGRQPTAIP